MGLLEQAAVSAQRAVALIEQRLFCQAQLSKLHSKEAGDELVSMMTDLGNMKTEIDAMMPRYNEKAAKAKINNNNITATFTTTATARPTSSATARPTSSATQSSVAAKAAQYNKPKNDETDAGAGAGAGAKPTPRKTKKLN